ncbi:SUF system NifU family Fe-S cluster assembly protein [Trueperella pyogenes]|mgnify:CR=1 FL=1|uniref:SUF system NifU family Fe-S cluster assembly protein n=1 Tax=Trueperella pyogenes TaxID=1661 RepID=A0A2S0RIR3_9ACTO|nr:SUF system NifU family Fe-S cluster assembly protein [Trueperella pyogenes]AJC69544.1 SUF system FeS assembly protein, NifU family [Trueperella pyogenes TP8]ALD74186.1 nitrogen fixation protein NifU [Trueperella pyogenes]AWA42553.1 SUF system NifU family Fe-S cluster assembly protein [Trueperella pyogenes]AWG04578.1 SUF system NifU family Fe-S cluster assembly protein [Trueperella pyogenes]AWG15407.1 SUF system NifU family Fe-S cluster assembly protein [Trueperella pyogenes]
MNELEQMYQEIILDAARDRHGEGQLADPAGESFQVNPTCGDQVTMQVNIEDGKIALAWDGHGCSISQASISVMSELVEGKTVEEFDRLFHAFRDMMDKQGAPISDADADLLDDATAFQGVSKYPMRIKCALLGWMALRDATDQALE